MTAEAVVAIIVAFISGSLGKEAAVGLRRWYTGRGAREKARIEELATEIRCERERADREASHRRRLQEALSATRRVAIDAGIDVTDLPDFPAAD